MSTISPCSYSPNSAPISASSHIGNEKIISGTCFATKLDMKSANSKKYRNMRHAAGLTLIELIIVIAIIGVLAAIAIPAYADYKEKARVYQAVTDISTMASKITHYYDDARDYPDSLADVGLDGMVDPWGFPYRYLNLNKNGNGGARRDRNLNPLNTDFDLYSVGKNAQTRLPISQRVSLDDVIRVYDGKFVNLASQF